MLHILTHPHWHQIIFQGQVQFKEIFKCAVNAFCVFEILDLYLPSQNCVWNFSWTLCLIRPHAFNFFVSDLNKPFFILFQITDHHCLVLLIIAHNKIKIINRGNASQTEKHKWVFISVWLTARWMWMQSTTARFLVYVYCIYIYIYLFTSLFVVLTLLWQSLKACTQSLAFI